MKTERLIKKTIEKEEQHILQENQARRDALLEHFYPEQQSAKQSKPRFQFKWLYAVAPIVIVMVIVGITLGTILGDKNSSLSDNKSITFESTSPETSESAPSSNVISELLKPPAIVNDNLAERVPHSPKQNATNSPSVYQTISMESLNEKLTDYQFKVTQSVSLFVPQPINSLDLDSLSLSGTCDSYEYFSAVYQQNDVELLPIIIKYQGIATIYTNCCVFQELNDTLDSLTDYTFELSEIGVDKTCKSKFIAEQNQYKHTIVIHDGNEYILFQLYSLQQDDTELLGLVTDVLTHKEAK